MRRRGTGASTGLAAIVAVLIVALAGCGGGTSGVADPAALLRQSKATVDAASALHFTLATRGASGSGLAIESGQGDLARPDKLRATFQVKVEGVSASVQVASAGGTFLAKLPFSSSYQKIDPATFGIANPAKLISPDGGLSSVLTSMADPRSTGQTRVDGEVLDGIAGTLPGTALGALPDDAPSEPVQAQAYIDPSNHQLRQISLTGPIGTKAQATYTVTLTDYGEQVDLSLPST